MIPTGLYQLTVQTLPKVVATSSVPPVAAAIVNKLSHRALLSKTGCCCPASSLSHPNRENDDLLNKSYSDAFDESDSLEVGKKEEPKHLAEKQQQREAYRLHPMFGPHFADIDHFFYSTHYFHDPFFSPLFRHHRSMMEPFCMSTPLMPVLRRRFPRDSRQRLLRASPAYEITESDGAYQIAVDVPEGLKQASDIQVQVEKDGSLVHLSGQRQTEQDGVKIMTRFDKHFTIGPNMNTDELTANFSDGTLVLTVPKIEVQDDSTRRAIPITGMPQLPRDEELVQKDYSDTFDESDWAETGKQGGKAE